MIVLNLSQLPFIRSEDSTFSIGKKVKFLVFELNEKPKTKMTLIIDGKPRSDPLDWQWYNLLIPWNEGISPLPENIGLYSFCIRLKQPSYGYCNIDKLELKWDDNVKRPVTIYYSICDY